MQGNTQRLKQTMATVFGVRPEAITDKASIETIDSWDSLRHLNLVLALEEEFNVRLPEEEMVELLDFVKIRAALGKQGVRFQEAA
jgi:acyl carrier protein